MKYLGPITDGKDLVNKDYVDNGLASKVPTSDYAPVAKTSDMTQQVGRDANGQLWTAPELPAVTAADNEKVLTVISGAWAAAKLPLYDGGVTYEP